MRSVISLSSILILSSSFMYSQQSASATQVVTFAVHRTANLQTVATSKMPTDLPTDTKVAFNVSILKVERKKVTVSIAAHLPRSTDQATSGISWRRQGSSASLASTAEQGLLVTVTD